MDEYTPYELMIITLAREIRDGQIVGAGVYSELPRSAIMLAQIDHAPNLIFHPTGMFVCNLADREPAVYHSCTDYRMINWAEQIRGHEEGFEKPSRYDAFFVSGIQIGKYGSINLIGIGQYPHLKLRGPGSVATASRSIFSRGFFIYSLQHTKRNFVEKVDYVSCPGYDRLDYSSVPGGGPKLVVTPFALMDFETNNKSMRLKSVHPGVSIEQVKENTGFDLVIPETVPETIPPTEREIKLLRTRIDKEGLFRKFP